MPLSKKAKQVLSLIMPHTHSVFSSASSSEYRLGLNNYNQYLQKYNDSWHRQTSSKKEECSREGLDSLRIQCGVHGRVD